MICEDFFSPKFIYSLNHHGLMKKFRELSIILHLTADGTCVAYSSCHVIDMHEREKTLRWGENGRESRNIFEMLREIAIKKSKK
jgi:hypothetical protein